MRTTDGGANWNEPGHLTKTLIGVCFANSNVGIAVGIWGSVLKTTDGGATWNAKSSGAQVDLFSVFFADKDTGFAVGHAGRILRTTNGGSDWIIDIYPMGREYGFNGVHFSKGNKSYGIAVGETGVICKTSNGGTNWDTSTVGITKLIIVFFLLIQVTR